ncbi:mitotic interactor and substrate of PLK1 [Perognathus longimembris pacificus]|uniref:mitotic interactor and substrate of PLK1 n=1 Tax=Perognathus longimembris pacificus TaxID=214514 RepID=UPI002018C621|nr:mitotic interactor and substrate of PLK1 [Perognathus longimembris pacificus]
MDRVTRYPIFSKSHSTRITGLALEGDNSYAIELVGVGHEANDWSLNAPQVWDTDYGAQLNMGRTGAPCSRLVSSSHISPRPLHLEEDDNDDEEMKTYYLDASDAVPRLPQDLEWERWAVIQGQAVKKGGRVATLRGTSDHRDCGRPSQPQPVPLEENLVDSEQIDFLSARQQFLSLEQAALNPTPPTPLARATPPRTTLGHSQAPKALNGPCLANGYVVPATPQMKEGAREKRSRGLPGEPSLPGLGSPSPQNRAPSPEFPKETPIEREIRLAQEREADLREQRGLQRATSHQELVLIPTRPVLSKVSLTEPPRRDRGRPSLYVQRDMVQETQREEDHRREGLQVGRASTPDWVSEGPQLGLRRSFSSDSILDTPVPDARAADQAPEVRKVNRIPLDAYQPYLGAGTPQQEFSAFRVYSKSEGLPTEKTQAVASLKATGAPRHHSESSVKPSSSKPAPSKPPRGSLKANRGVVRREYFLLRPLRFRVPDVPQQVEAPHVWGWEVEGAPVLRLQRSQSSDLLEKEVENVLRREREVAEERRNAFFPDVFSTTDEDLEQDSRSSSRASGITGSYSVSESPLFTPIHLHSGLVWTAQASPTDSAPGQKKKELWYAGINPSDQVNLEVLGATRVTRHKNAMAERWEARIYGSEDED